MATFEELSFEELSIEEKVCAVLKKQGITEATPVQARAIPAMRSGRDLIVQAQTGTGKTLAFLLPILEKIKTGGKVAQALVVAPTRELAIQTGKVAEGLREVTGVSSLVIYGGQDIERQKEKLRNFPQLIIGTPGRLLDHVRRRTLNLSQVNRIVLDEADEMMKMGFLEDVELLIKETAQDRQLLLFSATMPDRVRALSRRYMRNIEEIKIIGEHVTLDNIEQIILDTQEDTKLDKLCQLINERQPYLAMVFCRTKQRVDKVMMELAGRGYLADALHGDLSQVQRRLVLRNFQTAKLQILVTTDIAARGLDIEGVTHVFNYDIPQTAEDYIHRIGRTGRAGAYGVAITFVNARQYDKLREIEAVIAAHIKKEQSGRKKQEKKAAAIEQKKTVEKTTPKAKETRLKPKTKTKPNARKKASGWAKTAKKKAGKPAQKKTKTNFGKRAKL